jgi:hypothetical protein
VKIIKNILRPPVSFLMAEMTDEKKVLGFEMKGISSKPAYRRKRPGSGRSIHNE